ncbi:MAG: phosphoglycerate kinase [Desulfurococcaceae archaeon]
MNSLYVPILPTLRDLNIREKKVFMRIDINVPIDPDTGKIIDDRRIRVHAQYIKKLVEEHRPALVLGSHQGRPGSPDFTTLEEHKSLLEKYMGMEVKFVNDVIGPTALNAIKNLKPGEVLLLDNLRLVSEEIIEAPPEKHATSIFTMRVSSVIDVYVNDAFATAHRSQPSIVGLPLVVPSAIGPLFEKELEALRRVVNASEPPRVYVLGGKKVAEHLRVIENLVANKLADRVLTCGLLGLLFLAAKGVNIGSENVKLLEENGLIPFIPKARYLLLRGAPVETPVDFKVAFENRVVNSYLGDMKGLVMDIGEQTAGIYEELIKEAKTVVMRGPAGVIEKEEFRAGTLRLLNAALSSKGFVLIAGGHLSAMAQHVEQSGKVHVSTAGNSLLLFLSGEELPAFKALELSAKMFLGW